jgi:PTS system ascorbate-specific IIA component
MNGLLIIAHTPLAQAMRQGVLHVFPDAAASLVALDVPPDEPPEQTLARAQAALRGLDGETALVLTDIFGATPCNVAQKLVDGVRSKLLTGVNLPMLLRAWTYRHESLDNLLARAVIGGTQGIMQVAITAPQNQAKRNNDPDQHHHHQ